MKTTLDIICREELLARINLLDENKTALWGKMNVIQMIKHCILWEEMVFGEKTYKRVFIGRIFGKMALRNILKDDKPLKRNTPTIPEFIIKETSGNLVDEKINWIAIIRQYEHFTNDHFIHPFFGKMTKEQIGIMAYKHIDHHLRQFGV
ncbi:hypothetical protein ABIB40_001484 [Pedobacter sp. UYP30]|uniref:DinB family protein n=1 Tax=Pedobacter sp. UYP30 TaxID=1756400 RepID=UPI003398A112